VMGFFSQNMRAAENMNAGTSELVSVRFSMKMGPSAIRCFWRVALAFVLLVGLLRGQSQPAASEVALAQLVIIDTDIGDDVDDAFALAFALQSPELKILRVTTA
jgi:hypothetical protein